MLARIYTVIALLVFMILIFMGSAIEAAMLKGFIVFAVLVMGTKISVYLLDIIKENTNNQQKSSSHN